MFGIKLQKYRSGPHTFSVPLDLLHTKLKLNFYQFFSIRLAVQKLWKA